MLAHTNSGGTEQANQAEAFKLSSPAGQCQFERQYPTARLAITPTETAKSIDYADGPCAYPQTKNPIDKISLNIYQKKPIFFP